MISNIKYIPDNFAPFKDELKKLVSSKAYESIMNGSVQSMATLESSANLFEMTIGECLCNPDADKNKWSTSSTYFLRDSISDYIDCSLITLRDLSDHCDIPSSNFSKYKRGDFMPTLSTAQKLADFWGIEIADLFIPTLDVNVQAVINNTKRYSANGIKNSKKDYPLNDDDVFDRSYTHIKWMSDNLTRLVVKNNINLSHEKKLRRMIETNSGSLNQIESYAKCYGSSIGNMFVNPKYDLKWYNDSSVIFLSYNIEQYLLEAGITAYNIGMHSKFCKADSVYKFINGIKIPTLYQLQDLANTLDVEVSDLFITPDGA